MTREKSILKKADREKHPVNGTRLIYKWTISRGRDTYGYNICTLYSASGWGDEIKVSSCNGGGYDMRGSCLADWIKQNFPEELKKIKSGESSTGRACDGYYGLSFRVYRGGKIVFLKRWRPGASVRLDGACGVSSMQAILRKIGFTMEYAGRYPGDKDNEQYIIKEV